MTIRCEKCQLLIDDGDQIAHIGLCPWCWDPQWDDYWHALNEAHFLDKYPTSFPAWAD